MAHIPMVAVPDGVRVYDSGPDYFDRFTVIFKDGALYTMSTNALSDRGICRFEGMQNEVPRDPKAKMVEFVPAHVAERIKLLEV
jgi:hypothetical protein